MKRILKTPLGIVAVGLILGVNQMAKTITSGFLLILAVASIVPFSPHRISQRYFDGLSRLSRQRERASIAPEARSIQQIKTDWGSLLPIKTGTLRRSAFGSGLVFRKRKSTSISLDFLVVSRYSIPDVQLKLHGIDEIVQLKDLTELNLRGTKLHDENMAVIGRMRQLRPLAYGAEGVSDSAGRTLRNLANSSRLA